MPRTVARAVRARNKQGTRDRNQIVYPRLPAKNCKLDVVETRRWSAKLNSTEDAKTLRGSDDWTVPVIPESSVDRQGHVVPEETETWRQTLDGRPSYV